MNVRAILEERYGFDTGTWLLLSAAVAAPLALWVHLVKTMHLIQPPPNLRRLWSILSSVKTFASFKCMPG